MKKQAVEDNLGTVPFYVRSVRFEDRLRLYSAGVTDNSEKKQFILQWTDVCNKHETVANLAHIFDKQLQDKVDTLSKCIIDFNKAFTGKPTKYEGKIFESGIKENDDLVMRIMESVTTVIWAATQEKVKLFSKK